MRTTSCRLPPEGPNPIPYIKRGEEWRLRKMRLEMCGRMFGALSIRSQRAPEPSKRGWKVELSRCTKIRIYNLDRVSPYLRRHKKAQPCSSSRKNAPAQKQEFRIRRPPSFLGTKPQSDSRSHALVAVRARMSPTTPLCASRFWAVTACVYVSIVTRLDACRSNSCITLMSVLFARRSVE